MNFFKADLRLRDLKKELRKGLVKKSNYLIELYVPGEDSRPLPIMCQSVGLPQRTNSVVKVWHKGRYVTLRGETEFGDSVTLSFQENSQNNIRRIFDFWFKKIDDPDLHQMKQTDGLSGLVSQAQTEIKAQTGLIKDVKNMVNQGDLNQLIDFLSQDYPRYQTNVRIWQLDSQGNKIYGYELQNCFLSSLTDGDFSQNQNELQTFNAVLTYSEINPLQSGGLSVLSKLGGDELGDTIQSVKTTF